MNEINNAMEKIQVLTYGLEFSDSNNLFVFIDKVIKDNLLNTLKFEENREKLEKGIIYVLASISRKIIQELKEDKYNISNTTEMKNGEWVDIYFDRKKNKILSSRLDTYPTNEILLYRDKILHQTVDFFGKKEVLDIFYQAYLDELSHEALLETSYRRDVDSLLDLFNDLRYKEVRDSSILPALSDKFAEQLSSGDLKFKNIEEATKAYEKDGSLETLAQLKKLHMIKTTDDVENCDDGKKLGEMLGNAKFDCVKRIIIRRLAYLDVRNL